MNMIEMKDLTFSYQEGTPAIKDVSLDVKKGEWLTILGHNGSGKSTLSKLLIGLLKAEEGSIKVDGITLSEKTVYDIRRKIGIVFQNPDNQFVGVTVRDDIAFGLENLCVDRETMIDRVDEYAKKVDMFEFLDKEPQALSGGQKQRVAIAGILAMQTDVIIFDEATAMLDPKGRKTILDYIKRLNDEGVTIITITHDMRESVMSDRIAVLKDGKVLKVGPTKDVLLDKETLESSNLELLLPLEVMHTLEKKNIDHPDLKEYLWQLSLSG
ncbi:MAG: energy-coupling factor transporter ATPase [Candidatus Izemoplasmataceae bacterium]